MRKTFSKSLLEEMQKNDDIFLLVADLGYGIFDELQKGVKNFYNVGASEQLMIGTAIGLAQSGKIPICYSITPFLLYRPFEFIRNYINYENCPVKLVGSGRNKEYSHDGFSHWSYDDKDVLNLFTNIITLYPDKKEEIPDMVKNMIYNNKPTYLSLSRF